MDVNLAGFLGDREGSPGIRSHRGALLLDLLPRRAAIERRRRVLDNRPLPARQGDSRDLDIHTLGGDLLHVEPIGPGKADGMVWVAGQVGDWQSLAQGSWATAIEIGYQLPKLWSAPWLRAGFFKSSGDGDSTDQTTARSSADPDGAPVRAHAVLQSHEQPGHVRAADHEAARQRLGAHGLPLAPGVEGERHPLFRRRATKQDFFGYGGTAAGATIRSAT